MVGTLFDFCSLKGNISMISTTRQISVIDVEVDDELDLVDDEYGDNDLAMSEYARVLEINEVEDDESYPEVVIITTQGSFACPLNHFVKIKVDS